MNAAVIESWVELSRWMEWAQGAKPTIQDTIEQINNESPISKIAPNFGFQFLRNALVSSLAIVRFCGSTGRFREARSATGAPQTGLGTATSLKLYWH
jgi:hypothetical protein